MKLYLQFDDVLQTIEVPDDTDFTLMIENYYQEQIKLAKAQGKDISTIVRKTPQQIFDSFCNAEEHSFKKFKAHNVQPSFLTDGNDSDGEDFPKAIIADENDLLDLTNKENMEIVHQKILSCGITEEQYQILLLCENRTREETLEDIAAYLGISENALKLRLTRLKKKIREFLQTPTLF